MGTYKRDLTDIYFNLFNLLELQSDREEVESIISEYYKFSENEIFPTRAPSDEEGVKLVEGQVKVPECLKNVHKLYYENGWFGLGLEEEIGGTPVPESVYTACYSLGISANASWMMYPGLTRSALHMISKIGDDQIRARFIPPMIEGKWGGTMCLTEPEAGSDVGALTTTAIKAEGDKYKIKGCKIFISSGDNDLFENIIHLVLARTPGSPKGTKGISLFLVPKYKLEGGKSNDVICSKIEHKMGIHASATCELLFGENNDCEGYLIGKEHEGMKNMFVMMNEARLMTGLQGESQGNLAYQLTLQYVKEREQFGRAIGTISDVKRMVLKMRAMGRGLRSLCLYTANQLDMSNSGNQESLGIVEFLTPICKSYSTEEGFNMAIDSIQCHGGYGYCTEYGVEQFARDIKITTIYEGTNGIQAADFLGRKIFKDEGKTLKTMVGKVTTSISKIDDGIWVWEKEVLNKNLSYLDQIMSHFNNLVAEGKVDVAMSSATDFLKFMGNLLVNWLLLDSAIIAAKMIHAEDSEEMRDFYHSKIVDFEIFSQHKITENFGIAELILKKDDINKYMI